MAEQVFLGKYKWVRPLDEGGMCKIHLARQVILNREVAVKVLKEAFRAHEKSREHLRRETHITAHFQHPNAVAYVDAAPNDPSGPVLVLEYLRGVELGVLLRRDGRFSPRRVGRVLGQLCDVLQAAHDDGIVHRDVKPGNLMILHLNTPGETVKLMDFGLAKMKSLLYIAPDEVAYGATPAASGTPEYVAPEQARGAEADARSDLYSVGVTLYELLAGRRPFEADDPRQLLRCHVSQEPPTFAELGLADQVPPAVEDVVRRCLAKDPDRRPRGAAELALEYEAALGSKITQPRRPPAAAGRRHDTPAARMTPAGGTSSGRVPALRSSLSHAVDVLMPEAMALVKLKGFVYDLGGEVVESVPGMIRVRLPEPRGQKKSGFLAWLGGDAVATQAAGPEVELHMERKHASQPNQLTITLVMNPGKALVTTEMRERCHRIGRDLQAYLLLGR